METTEGLVSLNEEPLISMPGRSMSNVEFDMWALFHKLWSASVSTPGYDKKQWLELERRMMLALQDAAKR
jgi:hypothetical protein